MGSGWLAVVREVVRHPGLWPTALVQAARMRRRRWWRRAPFLPVPDRDYLRFRLTTAYGTERAPDPADVISYLEWCRSFPRR